MPRWLIPLVVLGAVGFLYVRPISSYLDTRGQLDDRRAEVEVLRAERARLQTRLEQETSVDGLARQARRIGNAPEMGIDNPVAAIGDKNVAILGLSDLHLPGNPALRKCLFDRPPGGGQPKRDHLDR